MSETVFCLMGPTASGKTDLACEIAMRFPVEIVSVDSALIYRDMDIGTAKPTPDILQQFPHHLVNIRDPIETYSAALFCHDVEHLIQEIRARGHQPLLVGGTMMYFRALQEGLNQLPETDPQVRQYLQQEDDARGRDGIYAWLSEVDPETAARLHPHDTQRILRALEVYVSTGQPMSFYLSAQRHEKHFQFVNLGLFPEDRAWLHQRIAERFEGMLTLGFLSEVESLMVRWSLNRSMPSMRCVGYRQALDYLEGVTDHASFVAQGVASTRQLAKRQLTWLRSWPDLTLVDPSDARASSTLLSYFEKYMT